MTEQVAAGALRTKRLAARTFDGAAATYDQIGPALFARAGRRLVEVADLRPGMRVLDVGTGVGAALVPAAQVVGPTGWVTGIDLSRGMLARARAAVAAAGLTNVRLRVGDAEAPAVGDGRVDRVLAGQVLFFLPDLDAALDAYARILVPGGLLACSSWGPDEERWGPVYGALLASVPASTAQELMPSGAAFRTDEDLTTLLDRHGWTDVRHTSETYDVVFTDPDEWLASTRSHGALAFWDAIPADRLDEATAQARSLVATLQEADGTVLVRTTARYTTAQRPG